MRYVGEHRRADKKCFYVRREVNFLNSYYSNFVRYSDIFHLKKNKNIPIHISRRENLIYRLNFPDKIVMSPLYRFLWHSKH